MPDSPNNEAPPKPRPRTLTTEQIEEARNRYVRNGENEGGIAFGMGVPRSAVVRAKRACGDWDTLRESWRASGKAANDRYAASEADTKAAVNQFQARVSQALLSLLEAKARVISDADEKDPETARRTMRALGSIKAIAEVQRLAHDMVTARTATDGVLSPEWQKFFDLMQRIEQGDSDDGESGPDGSGGGVARAVPAS